MQTSWGEIAVYDAHVHFFSRSFFSGLARQSGQSLDSLAALPGVELPAEAPETLAERWAAELDRNGVESAVLIASAHGDEGSVAAAVTHLPGRFHGWFMLNPVAPDAPDRARRAFETGLRGVCLFPAMHRYPVHDERVDGILELAAAAGAIVFVHCGALSVGIRAKFGIPSPFDMRFSNPIDLHPVALRHPEINFVVPHFGAGYFREALMLCDLCPNVHLDTSSSNSWMRYEGLDLARVFERALALAGPRRLLFGTDSSTFPRGWNRNVFEEQSRALQAAGVSRNEAELVFGGNLRRLLGR